MTAGGENMLKNPDYTTARDLLLNAMIPVRTERIALTESGGRILARNLTAAENNPRFDQSPYDGYAFRAADTRRASREHPVTLRILEEIPAGAVPTFDVTEGTAVKILTGAPIPNGADAVIKYEFTEFTKETVTVFSPSSNGENIIYAGEDVRAGDILAHCGDVIDPGIAGALASQGIETPEVYCAPRIGILSTGSELSEASGTLKPGKRYDSNRYMLETALKGLGYKTTHLGIAEDSTEEICARIKNGLAECDAIVSTGGVSAGDYDMTPDAMEMAGVELLFRGVDIKPGMACAYGIYRGKPVCGLSGNPASALTNFYAVALPALKKLMGHRDPLPQEIRVRLADGFGKKSPKTRFLRGKLALDGGMVRMLLPKNQGNVVLSSAIGCNVMAIVPAGSGPIEADTVLGGFLI